MTPPRHQILYQVNTRAWLTDLGRELGRPATLDDIPDDELDRFAKLGFDWVWFLSVWQTGLAGRNVSRGNTSLREELQRTLPDLCDADIAGSGFAITAYTVSAHLGGDEALARLRGRLRKRGLRLMLDFVPNHTALDHHWTRTHPEFYVDGTEADITVSPHCFARVEGPKGSLILAHGRDPYFPAWTDTLQLNYGNSATQDAMIAELLAIADRCDAVRCDMAMLLLPEVFERTWQRPAQPFWSKAIQRIRQTHPDFVFLAEAYWDLERTLQQQGFDFTYDKGLYDRLIQGPARPVRDHFKTDIGYQAGLVRFLENHDEPRVAALLPVDVHKAAAIVTFLCLGLSFFHQGQLEGYRKHISAHVVRAAHEIPDEELGKFYESLLALLRREELRGGHWRLLACSPAWQDNWTSDCFIAFWWQGPSSNSLLVTVNYSPHRSQCYVRVPLLRSDSRPLRFQDLLSSAEYARHGDDLATQGLYLDLPPWGYHVFTVSPTT